MRITSRTTPNIILLLRVSNLACLVLLSFWRFFLLFAGLGYIAVANPSETNWFGHLYFARNYLKDNSKEVLLFSRYQ